MTTSPPHRVVSGVLLVAVVATAGCWYWADQAYREGARTNGMWIAIAGSALPALAAASCLIWLTRPSRRSETPPIRWLPWFVAVSILFLAAVAFLLRRGF